MEVTSLSLDIVVVWMEGRIEGEDWESRNTYVNHWESPTHMLDLTESNFLFVASIGTQYSLGLLLIVFHQRFGHGRAQFAGR